MKVENMKSSKGNKIANQFIITEHVNIGKEFGEFIVETFQSYATTIAIKAYCGGCDHGVKVKLDRDKWDCSVTTGKYRNQFLGEGIVETRAKIKSGEYILADLN